MSLETAKLGFSRVHDGEMLCCTTERAEYITKAVNSYAANQATIESQSTQIEQLQAQNERCREALTECKACQMMPGEIEKITTEALQAIEKI
jgi:hypothetical protein